MRRRRREDRGAAGRSAPLRQDTLTKLLATSIPHELWRALSFAFGMTWEIVWALIVGFGLSAVVQALLKMMDEPMGDEHDHHEHHHHHGQEGTRTRDALTAA